MKPIIEVENVSKKFYLKGRHFSDLRERFSPTGPKRLTAANAVSGLPGAAEMASKNIHWALEDVSFSVEKGETLGIVGHNGSGKSTMLKLLTHILVPTRGKIKVRGRIGALIEVGAGFHPDLTGRENIYLSGSVQGLSRRDVAARFDQIVDFANMGRFIDMPVKRYSSGMYMRLGFSIAAHIDADLLLIDEVLAVGDALFQRKCLRRLKEYVHDGGTLVFISHAMGQVAEVCQRCVWLDHGKVRYVGETATAVEKYMSVVQERQNAELQRTHPDEWEAMETERIVAEEERREREEAERREREEAERAEAERRAVLEASRAADTSRGRLVGVTLRDQNGSPRTRFRAGEPVLVEIAYKFGRNLPYPIFGFDLFRVSDEQHIYTTSNHDNGLSLHDLPPSGTITLKIDALNLNTGRYRVQINLFGDNTEDRWWETPEDEIAEAVIFEVVSDVPAQGWVHRPLHWVVVPTSILSGMTVDRAINEVEAKAI
jgi:ABC-type polysaccharide/polyol phosphate transport system ATPase subunit